MNPICLATLLVLAAPEAPAAARASEPPAVPGAGDAPTAAPRADAAPAPAALSLDEALAELDRQSLTLAQARSRADEAAGLARQAAAPLLPTATAGATWAWNSDAAVVRLPLNPPRTLTLQPSDSTTVSGALRVPLVQPTAWFDLAAARAASRAAADGAAATRLTVRTGFAQAAHQAVAAAELVTASEQAVENAAELARSADRRVAAGTAAPLDALRARTELVRRQSDLADARAGLERAELALGILLGRDAPVRVRVPEPTALADPAPAGGGQPASGGGGQAAAAGSGLVAEALAHRPELSANREQVDAAEQGLRSAWWRLAPQLSATGTLFRSDVPYVTGKEDGWRVTLDLTWTLYDGGARYGKRRQAEAQLAGARAGAEAERLAVVQEVRDAARDLAVAHERLRLAATQRELAAEARASAQRSFDAGVASSLDVIDTNDRLFQADVALAAARARLAQARLGLLRALGRES